jgi:hypothetical protein
VEGAEDHTIPNLSEYLRNLGLLDIGRFTFRPVFGLPVDDYRMFGCYEDEVAFCIGRLSFVGKALNHLETAGKTSD